MKINIRDIISERISIQATRRELVSFGIKLPSIALFESDVFKNSFLKWPEEKQNKFIKIIGGPVNFKKTKEYIKGKGNYVND